MAGYHLFYTDPHGIVYALFDDVTSWLIPNSMKGFGAIRAALPSEQRPYHDGGVLTGPPRTPSRVLAVGIGMACATHAEVVAYYRTMCHNLSAYKVPTTLGTLSLITPDGLTRSIGAWLVEVDDPEWDGPVKANVGLVFEAPYPFFYDVAQSVSFSLFTVAGVTFPAAFDVATGLPFISGDINSIFTASNAGEVPTWPVITVYGPADNPTIGNHTTGKEFVITQLMDASDYIIIDMAAATVKLWDNSAGTLTSIITTISAASEFWYLQPGDNTIHVTLANVGNGSALFAWSNYYLSGM